jgi:hypothetical protein
MPKMPYVSQTTDMLGTYQQKSQNSGSNINMERNTPDLYDVLKQNPYAIKRTYK